MKFKDDEDGWTNLIVKDSDGDELSISKCRDGTFIITTGTVLLSKKKMRKLAIAILKETL